MEITWDEAKNVVNARKHSVTFSEARTVFEDADAIYVHAPDSSDLEERWVSVGRSDRGRLLIVVHRESEHLRLIRVISARKANRAERRDYETRYEREGN